MKSPEGPRTQPDPFRVRPDLGRNNQPASRPIRSAVVASMAVAAPALLCLLHWKAFGVWHPYGVLTLAGIGVATVLVKSEKLRAMRTRELLEPVLHPGRGRTIAIVVAAAMEVTALFFGMSRLWQRHVLFQRLSSADPCAAESVDPKQVAEFEAEHQRDESIAACSARRASEAKQAAQKQCDDFVTSLSSGQASPPPATVGALAKIVLVRATQRTLTVDHLDVSRSDLSACDGRLWPFYVKATLNSPQAWGDVSSAKQVSEDLRNEITSGGQGLSEAVATALLANVEAKAQKMPPSGSSQTFAATGALCALGTALAHKTGPACASVTKLLERTLATEEAKRKTEEAKQTAKDKAEEARAEAKRKAEEAREQAHAAAADRCRKGCDGLMPSSANDPDDRWDKCMERCSGIDKLNAPLF